MQLIRKGRNEPAADRNHPAPLAEIHLEKFVGCSYRPLFSNKVEYLHSKTAACIAVAVSIPLSPSLLALTCNELRLITLPLFPAGCENFYIYCGVPQGSILGPLISFTSYSPPRV